MKPRDRVEAALALDIADRPPVSMWGHDYLREWSVKDLADSHIQAQRRFGWDFVKFQPRATCYGEAFGTEFRPSGDPHEFPVFVRPAVQDPQELSRIEPVPASVAPLADQVEAVGLVASELGPGVPVLQTVFSPLSVADFLVPGEGPKSILPALKEEPDAVTRAMRAIAETMIDFARRSIEAGAAGIFFGILGFAGDDVLSERDYEELALPHDLTVLTNLPSAAWFNVVHLCGPRAHFGLAGRFPAQAFSWSVHDEGNPSLAEGIERTGRAAMGGVAQRTTLVTGPANAIADEVRVAASSKGGRGILVAPGCSIPTETPVAHLEAVSKAAGATETPNSRSRP
jgi:uroporphyrinogen decarboxylase